MLESRVLDFLRPRTGPGDIVVAAVSGGPDSTALLHVLLAVRDTLGVDVEVAHCDHGLRGDESDGDARFVRSLAREAGLTFHHRAVDTAAEHAERGGSLEAVAREARRAFLEEARRVAGARWILTGHTRDDQAETVLLNLFRGAGPRGLGGMLREGPGPVLRPFLDTAKDEILAWLAERGMDWRQDRTNLDPAFARNQLRAELVPQLRDWYGPSVVRTLAREADLFAEVDDLLRTLADELLVEAREPSPDDEIRLRRTPFTAAHPALGRAALRRVIEDLLGDVRGLTTAHVDALLELAGRPSAGTTSLDLPRGLEARREYDRLVLGFRSRTPSSPPRTTPRTTSGAAAWNGWRLRWAPGPLPRATGAHAEAFRADALGPALTLRGPKPGDRMAPKGMEGHRLVSDVLIDAKVPRRARAALLLLCDNGGPSGAERILWVVGQRRSRHALPGGETAQVAYFQAETTV